MIFDWRMMPMIPAMAMPPMPIGLPMKAKKRFSAVNRLRVGEDVGARDAQQRDHCGGRRRHMPPSRPSTQYELPHETRAARR